MYIVPSLVVSASASLLLSNEFSSQSFLLNGMAICFSSNVDDLLVFFFVSETEREVVEEGIDAILVEEEVGKGWLKNMVYGAVLSPTLSVVVMFCEKLMFFFEVMMEKATPMVTGAPKSEMWLVTSPLVW